MTTPTNPTYTWRCTSCPKEERVSVETSSDVAPVCPRCKKVMKVSDCCGCGEPSWMRTATAGWKLTVRSDTPVTDSLQHRWGHDSDIDVEEILESHAQLERELSRINQNMNVHTMTEEELDTPRPFGYYPPTTIDRRLDDTERMVDLLVERLGRVTVLPDDAEAVVRSALSEQIDRINGKLGTLLGGLDLS